MLYRQRHVKVMLTFSAARGQGGCKAFSCKVPDCWRGWGAQQDYGMLIRAINFGYWRPGRSAINGVKLRVQPRAAR